MTSVEALASLSGPLVFFTGCSVMPGDFGVSNACAVMFTDCLDVSKDRWLVKTEFGCCFIGEYCNVPLSDARLLDFHVVYDKNVFD